MQNEERDELLKYLESVEHEDFNARHRNKYAARHDMVLRDAGYTDEEYNNTHQPF
tara:strand:+ start:607 stop:771 length:165 start_codon:yes stop_codon:yes gene_type:complete